MTETKALLEIRDVRRSFVIRGGILGRARGEVHAVAGVSLAVGRGETLGLVGESGCGKSTLGRMAVGLLPPDSGEILLAGHPVGIAGRKDAAATTDHVRGRLQMIFQDPFSSLNPRLRIGTSVGEPLLAEKLSRNERREQIAAILKQVGLDPACAQRYPHEFSGGQRQRIAIARALVTRPDLVVCDEAVSALDASVQAQVLNLLKDVQERFSLSYLFISHDLGVVGYMSDRVAVMYLGRIVEQAPSAVLFHHATHPYTQALLNAVPSLNHREKQEQYPFPTGEPPNPFAPPSGCAFHPRCSHATVRCREETPPLREIHPGHLVACHLVSLSVSGISGFA